MSGLMVWNFDIYKDVGGN